MTDLNEPTNNAGNCQPPSGTNVAKENIVAASARDTLLPASPTLSVPPEGNSCRICYGTADEKDLYLHCQCKGSVGLTHPSCLVFWIKKSGSFTCELCFEKYNTTVQMNKKIWQWKFPHLPVKERIKLFFFTTFLTLFITFITWVELHPIPAQLEDSVSKNTVKKIWPAYMLCAALLLLPVIGVCFANYWSFVGYVKKFILQNQNIVVIPKHELCKDQLVMEDEKKLHSINYSNTASRENPPCTSYDLKCSHIQVQETAVLPLARVKCSSNIFVLFPSDLTSDISAV